MSSNVTPLVLRQVVKLRQSLNKHQTAKQFARIDDKPVNGSLRLHDITDWRGIWNQMVELAQTRTIGLLGERLVFRVFETSGQ